MTYNIQLYTYHYCNLGSVLDSTKKSTDKENDMQKVSNNWCPHETKKIKNLSLYCYNLNKKTYFQLLINYRENYAAGRIWMAPFVLNYRLKNLL